MAYLLEVHKNIVMFRKKLFKKKKKEYEGKIL